MTEYYSDILCPKCGEKCDTDYEADQYADHHEIFHIWCPVCEHTYEIHDIGLRPLGLEDE